MRSVWPDFPTGAADASFRSRPMRHLVRLTCKHHIGTVRIGAIE